MRIALTGGGTGGHLFPILAVVQEIKKMVAENIFQVPSGEGTGVKFMFIGPKTIGEETLANEGIDRKIIMAGKLRRYASLQNIFDIFKIPGGLIQSLWHLFWFMPNVVFSKGGYGSVPVVLAAWIYHIPIIIHESDSVPGLANKFCAAFSWRVAISFMEAAKYFPTKKTALTGNPVRSSLFTGNKEAAKQLFGLSGQKNVLLILGGSQGAQAINDLVFTSLLLVASRCEIIHQCGANNIELAKQMIGDKAPADYHLLPFLDEEQMRQALAAADLVIARAGAGTIAEIAALGKPSILIPLLNAAADHQLKNATEFAKLGGAVIMEEMNLTPHLFQNQIFSLLDNPDLMKKMGANAKQFAHPDAARLIAQEILNLAKT
ncbi:undecaprenyldiphospho-muramoylpentapeptide beta-N-acetylglucosaminyltransferase [Patescibacteria group bacterium]|nr:undecaprenyldiphospho-muramoylpentapeptide beta-N-acetylglucosaminyltransferase [Patescibacteria group bacterium]MBU2220230.1 undecaprenyldiphospho-muramoylpentapeptide beta-N-acetylglucosaminyltransferase [Patescibacteria group bacterium]MBU2265080.1 undecaprenyldiphospho-muramoylpentapeptide beta-N-acetylglucosaminyltransferase [Patescibacteria group bacterium]